jgi:hypothetical protein
MPGALDVTGERFGRLVAIGPTQTRYFRQVVWDCKCDCGKMKTAPLGVLRRGHIQSCGCLKKRPSGIAATYGVLVHYRAQAKSRGLAWSLTDIEAYSLFEGNCFYCDAVPSNVGGSKWNNGKIKYSGIDRVNNNLPYTVENCVSCCKICNKAKQQMSVDAFRKWVQNIYSNFGRRT